MPAKTAFRRVVREGFQISKRHAEDHRGSSSSGKVIKRCEGEVLVTQSRASLSKSAVSPSIINPLTKPAFSKLWNSLQLLPPGAEEGSLLSSKR